MKNAVKVLVSALLMLFSFTVLQAHSQPLSIHLDTSFSRQLLAEVCSNKTLDVEAIKQDQVVNTMLSHFAKFRDYFTMSNYLLARQNAANCKTNSPDYFRFNSVVENKSQLAIELDAVDSVDISSAIDMLGPYMPTKLNIKSKATIMIGTPSCGGWSAGDDFYVDLPCLKGDVQGLIYLSSHEIYHAVQNHFFYQAPDNSPVEHLLSEIIKEGSATAIVNFNDIKDGGAYTQKSQQQVATNNRRMQSNFDLFEVSLAYLIATPNSQQAQRIYNIGLSGSFDAPFYAMGATMFNAIEQALNRETLLCLVALPPQHFFKAYIDVSQKDPNLPTLGLITSQYFESVDNNQCYSF